MDPILETIGVAAVRIAHLEADLAERDAENERLRAGLAANEIAMIRQAEAISRLRDELSQLSDPDRATLIWAKKAYDFLSTYLDAMPQRLRDVPAVVKGR